MNREKKRPPAESQCKQNKRATTGLFSCGKRERFSSKKENPFFVVHQADLKPIIKERERKKSG